MKTIVKQHKRNGRVVKSHTRERSTKNVLARHLKEGSGKTFVGIKDHRKLLKAAGEWESTGERPSLKGIGLKRKTTKGGTNVGRKKRYQ